MIAKIFSSLKIGQKLALICVCFSLPIAVLLGLVVKEINYSMNFGLWEVYGDAYQRPLERLLKAIPEHGLLAKQNRAAKTPTLKEALAAKAAEVDEGFAALAQAQARHGTDLQFTAEGLAKRQRSHFRNSTVQAEWEQLKGSGGALSSAESSEKHAHLVADVRTMITHAGDISNLILDPDLDTYYQMDCTLLALPETQDRIGQILAWGWDTLAGAKPGHEAQVKLAVFASLLQADLNRVTGSMQTALNEDLNFYGVTESFQNNIPPALAKYKQATEPFIALLEKYSRNPGEADVDRLFKEGLAAREAAFDLWHVSVDEEDAMLRNRVGVYKARRTRAFYLTFAAVLVALGLAWFIARSVTGPIWACLEALKSHAAMDFTRTVPVERDDEIGQIARGINSVSGSVRETVRGILDSSESLSDTAQNWASVSQELVQKVGGPAAKEMASSVQKIAVNAVTLQQLASKFKVN